jgi:hypothetical protein
MLEHILSCSANFPLVLGKMTTTKHFSLEFKMAALLPPILGSVLNTHRVPFMSMLVLLPEWKLPIQQTSPGFLLG